jgi:hypothetical protein
MVSLTPPKNREGRHTPVGTDTLSRERGVECFSGANFSLVSSPAGIRSGVKTEIKVSLECSKKLRFHFTEK